MSLLGVTRPVGYPVRALVAVYAAGGGLVARDPVAPGFRAVVPPTHARWSARRGGQVATWATAGYHDPRCGDCTAGTCVQRVTLLERSRCLVVIHTGRASRG